jgi:hypothetical protein
MRFRTLLLGPSAKPVTGTLVPVEAPAGSPPTNSIRGYAFDARGHSSDARERRSFDGAREPSFLQSMRFRTLLGPSAVSWSHRSLSLVPGMLLPIFL